MRAKHELNLLRCRWRDAAYLKQLAGLRTVPVEVGSHYLEESWTQKLVPFADFVDSVFAEEYREYKEERGGGFGGGAGGGMSRSGGGGEWLSRSRGGSAKEDAEGDAGGGLQEEREGKRQRKRGAAEAQGEEEEEDDEKGDAGGGGVRKEREERRRDTKPETQTNKKIKCPVAYLAQHDLFEQVPELRADIVTPDYTALSAEASGGEVITNAWFGPGGTVSPLHFDDYHNIFVQVVGRKYIRLYKPQHSAALYPNCAGGRDYNSSRVSVEDVDDLQFPLFRSAPYLEVELGEGETLFIPRGHWHYVRSLCPSFSVSFWWR
jgi:hypothetical protein